MPQQLDAACEHAELAASTSIFERTGDQRATSSGGASTVMRSTSSRSRPRRLRKPGSRYDDVVERGLSRRAAHWCTVTVGNRRQFVGQRRDRLERGGAFGLYYDASGSPHVGADVERSVATPSTAS
jgi:hypothetical protein